MADIFATRTLIKTQELLFPTRRFLRDTFTRTGESFVTELVDVQTRKGQRKTAPYVNPLLPGKIIERTGFKQQTFQPAIVKPMRAITQVDLGRAGFGENVYGTKTPAQRAEELLARDQAELDDYITRREEVMAAELIFTGKITQIGDGVNQVLDFEFENYQVLAAADRFNAATSDPFLILRNAKMSVQQKSGLNVRKAVFAADALDAFMSNPKVQAYINQALSNFTVGRIAPGEEVDGATYVGTINYPGVNLDIWTYNEIYIEDYNPDGTQKAEGVATDMVPSGTVALLPDGNPFEFRFGAITIANPLTQGFETYAMERVPQSWISIEPPARFLQISSRPILVPDNVDGWYVLKVI